LLRIAAAGRAALSARGYNPAVSFVRQWRLRLERPASLCEKKGGMTKPRLFDRFYLPPLRRNDVRGIIFGILLLVAALLASLWHFPPSEPAISGSGMSGIVWIPPAAAGRTASSGHPRSRL
jgi:hypothetical protein